MKSRVLPALLLVSGLLLAAGRAAAADPAESTVSAVGMGSVEKRPDLLRMTTELQIEGATLKDALAKLNARRNEIKESLGKLGAADGSIDLGDPRTVDANTGNQRAAMERMMRERMAGTRPAAGAPAPKTVSVSATIKADFPLKSGTPEEMLVSATELQDKIKDAKLFEVPKSAAKSEEDEEGNSGFPGGGDQGPKPGEPVFFFVAKISPAEQTKAVADAFAKSRTAADQLAKAAGASLGSLRSLTSQSNDADASMMDYSGYSSRYDSYTQRYLYQMARQNAADASGVVEAFSAQPAKITHQVFVSATFAIK